MILESLKNYIKCVKYLLIIMGIVYFFFILAIFTFLQGAYTIITAQSAAVYEQVVQYVAALFGQDLNGAAVFAGGGFWYQAFNDLVDILKAGGETSFAEIGTLVVVSCLLIVIGLKLSESASSYFFKKEYGDQNTKRGLLNWLIKYLIGVLFAFAFSAFQLAWKYGGMVVIAVYLLVNAAQTLYQTWFVYFSNSDRKDFGRAKNVWGVVLVMLFCYAIFAAIFYLLYWFVSPVLAFLIAVPLFLYTDQIITITTVTHFKKIVQKKTENRLPA